MSRLRGWDVVSYEDIHDIYQKRILELEADRDRLTLALKDARRSLALEMYAGSRSKTAKIIEDALADDTA